MVDPAAAQRLAERLGDVILALDLSEAGRTIPAVQGQRRGRRLLRLGRGARTLTGTGGVTCHELILAGRGKEDTPHTRQSPRTLAAFRPWGSWRDKRRARGLSASLARPGDTGASYPATRPRRGPPDRVVTPPDPGLSHPAAGF